MCNFFAQYGIPIFRGERNVLYTRNFLRTVRCAREYHKNGGEGRNKIDGVGETERMEEDIGIGIQEPQSLCTSGWVCEK